MLMQQGPVAAAAAAAVELGGSGASAKEEEVQSALGGEKVRPKWRSETEFLLTLVGYAVGIGNVWRFPYLCFSNGGACFLIPYLLTLCFLGIPIFCLELACGQRFRKDSLSVWPSIHPALGGIGVSSVLTTFYVSIYYNVILAWALVYFGASFTSPLPWAIAQDANGNVTMDADIYFEDEVLQKSDGFADLDGVPWRLFLCLLVAWLLIYAIIYKGIESSGRVVYFTSTFPYLVLTVMVLRGVTLPGASAGLRFYLVPDWAKLADPSVWVKAANQVFFSLGVGWGTHLTYASYNPTNHNFLRTTWLVPSINAATSFYAGFAVFGTLGYLAHRTGTDVADLQAGGFGLAFVAYPAALDHLGAGAANCFSVLFFFMLVLLAIDSAFALTETVIVAVIESGALERSGLLGYGGRVAGGRTAADHKQKITAAVCVFSWLLGFFCISRGGFYWVQMLDSLAVGFTLFAVSGMEAFAISYCVGVDEFLHSITQMLGGEVATAYAGTLRYVRFCWAFACPVLCAALTLTTLVLMFAESHRELVCRDPSAPSCDDSAWGVGLGVFLCCAASSAIPLVAFRHWYKSRYIEGASRPSHSAGRLFDEEDDASAAGERHASGASSSGGGSGEGALELTEVHAEVRA